MKGELGDVKGQERSGWIREDERRTERLAWLDSYLS